METEDLLRVRLDGRAPSLRSARVGISEEIDRVVAKALARDPQARHATAGAFARELLAASQRDDATGVLPPVTRPLSSGRRREFHIDTTIALLAIVAVLVATLAIFASFQGRGVGAPPASGAPSSPAASVTPNVVGKDVDEAGRLLIAAGYRSPGPWQVDPPASGTACSVSRQEPAAGAAGGAGAAPRPFLVGGKDRGGG